MGWTQLANLHSSIHAAEAFLAEVTPSDVLLQGPSELKDGTLGQQLAGSPGQPGTAGPSGGADSQETGA